MEGLESIIREHPFFAGIREDFCQLVCGCAKNERFEAGEYLFHEGDPADRLYLIRHGQVALEVSAPGRGEALIQTLGAGEIAGVSWLIPPYQRTSDAKALELVRVIAMDAKCLRNKCDEDHDLGYDVMQRFMPVLVQRLANAQVQLLDVYGNKP